MRFIPVKTRKFLPPKDDLFKLLDQSLKKLKDKDKNLGVIIIDSFCLPMRLGHYGISIGFWGFHPNKSYDGTKDIFGNKIILGNSNYVDALSAIAGVLMGEGNEQTPLLIVRGAKFIKFTGKNTLKEIAIPGSGRPDFYSPLLAVFKRNR